MVKINKIYKSSGVEGTLTFDLYTIHFSLKNIRVNVTISIKHYVESDTSFCTITISDVLYSTSIIRHFESTTFDTLENITYELLGRYFGIYEGSKPEDLEYFVFDNSEDRELLESIVTFNT